MKSSITIPELEMRLFFVQQFAPLKGEAEVKVFYNAIGCCLHYMTWR